MQKSVKSSTELWLWDMLGMTNIVGIWLVVGISRLSRG